MNWQVCVIDPYTVFCCMESELHNWVIGLILLTTNGDAPSAQVIGCLGFLEV